VESSLRELFAKTRVYCAKQRYVIVGLKKDAQLACLLPKLGTFSSVTIEKDEISVVLRHHVWRRCQSHYQGAKVAGPYRLIGFNVTIDLDVCGYFAAISSVLTGIGVSIIPISTYLRDYILVSEANHKRALLALNHFLKQQRDAQLT